MSPKLPIRRSVLLPALLGAVVGGTWGRPAFADPGEAPAEDAIRIESSTCSHALLDEVQRFLHVELKNASLGGGERPPRVILSCSARVSLIRALINGREGSRQLDLESTEPALYARVIALATAELLRDTARGEAVEPPPPAPTSKTLLEPQPEPTPSAPIRAPSSSHLLAMAKLLNFSSSFQPLSGAGLDFSHHVGHFALGLGPTLVTGTRTLALGSVRVVAADLSLRFSYRIPNLALPAAVGVGHALGWARLNGTSAAPGTNAASVSGLWAGPFAFGNLDVGLSEPLYLELTAQLGVVTIPVRGKVEHDADVAIAGLWGGVGLGLGLNL